MFADELATYSSILSLTQGETKDWRQLLRMGDALSLNEKRKYLWSWPTAEDLEELKRLLQAYNIRRMLSIGCGCGLLEWLITESTGAATCGLERDRSWWQSSYSVKNFIDIKFYEDFIEEDTQDDAQCPPDGFLKECCGVRDWNFALLFCYFNNREAFLRYLDVYRGSLLIIIGPHPEMGIHTDPSPLEPHFPNNSSWRLRDKLNMRNNDIVAIYGLN